jgi:hypothetical protein
LGEKSPHQKLTAIKEKYGEEYSVAFEELYNIPKEKYFATTRNNDPATIVYDTTATRYLQTLSKR